MFFNLPCYIVTDHKKNGVDEFFIYGREIMVPITLITYHVKKYGVDLKILWYPNIVRCLIYSPFQDRPSSTLNIQIKQEVSFVCGNP